ncbi:response regulator [candidate division KSB1 bacterium]|nr:response regulator [candidate division KSB1 bacterium]
MQIRTLRMLIVDDSEDWRELLKSIFEERTDLAISEAISGEDAVKRIKAEDYDLVLLDMRMPSGTEGLDALLEIKKVKPQTHVMMISAYGDIHKAVEAMKRGALDFVTKEADFKDVITFKVNEFIQTTHLAADRELLIHAKYEDARRFKDARKKGKALEDLLAALFASVEGFIQIDRNVNTATEEIDIVFRNESRNPSWQKESEIILVECKNWSSQRIGKNEFVLFKEKIENRYGRCKLGFLVCTTDFTEMIEREMLRSSKTDLLVVPINGDDLRQLVESKNRSQLLRSFVDRALLV